jgi:chromosome partitioning protein
MPKIITLFNHKGGVGKTTVAHNLGVSLTKQGKNVLLIDADPQMNLTSSFLGLADSVEYAEKNQSAWKKAREKYTNISNYLNWCITKSTRKDILEINLARYFIKAQDRYDDLFSNIESKVVKNPGTGNLDLLCGDIELFKIESLIFNITTNKLNNSGNNTTVYAIEDGIRNGLGQNYDYVLIDTSPSASSMVNGVMMMMSDYFLCPVFPNFFSLQAIDNLYQVIENWISLLKEFRETANNRGLSFEPKFLGIVINMARRYNTESNEGVTEYSKNWRNLLNQSIQKFYRQIYDSKRTISETEFRNIFKDRIPFVIEELCSFTDMLRSYAEYAGVPVLELTKELIKENKSKVGSNTPVLIEDENNHYGRVFKEATESYNFIAKSITENLQ